MSTLPSSFYWYDYETFGISPAHDRAVQFAGLRTDLNLKPVGDPLLIYNRLTDDYLPDPDACKVTGLSPQSVNEKGVCERDFIGAIAAELSEPGTCNIGYNNIRFDDEFTRYTLFRNFHDPYAHEWRNGNSRWDLLDFVRMARALRPDGIEWPLDEQGLASNRLEHLTQANGLSHENAHDALSDVEATISVARLIKEKQPKLFEYALTHYNKRACAEMLDLRNVKMTVHVSGMIPRERSHLSVVAAITQHPQNRNGIIAFDLYHDPEELIALASRSGSGALEIANRVFTKTEDLPPGVSRLPLKTIGLNKAPALAPVNVIRPSDSERLELDLEQHERHFKKLLALTSAQRHEIQQAFNQPARPSDSAGKPAIANDIDSSLYSGSFASHRDAALFETIRRSDERELSDLSEKCGFDDDRFTALLYRYRARNYPASLDSAEQATWVSHCRQAIDAKMSFETFKKKLDDQEWNKPQLVRLKESLLIYADELYSRLHD